jgi:hypothetical protein
MKTRDTTSQGASKRPRKPTRDVQQKAAIAADPTIPTADKSHSGAQLQSKPQSKAALLLEMLARPEGATLNQMVAATGWLPHTTRAALTGLKKKGHEVTSTKFDDLRTYRLVPSCGAPQRKNARTDEKAPV